MSQGEAELKFGFEDQEKKKHLNSSYPPPEPRRHLSNEDHNISTGKVREEKIFCGGIVKLSSNTPALISNYEGLNVGAYTHYPGAPKWRTTTLTYSILNYTRDVARDVVNKAIKAAFDVWSTKTPLKFVEVPKNGNISISFYKRGHKAPFNTIVAGYAYGPGTGLGGDVFMNDEMDWTMDNEKTFKEIGILNILLALAHEFGHALGLGHSNVLGALMKEEYTPFNYIYGKPRDCRTLQLHSDDVEGIQALYGSRTNPIPVK
ncbi:stromelysin-1-like isoform X2 [Paroedura picta]|uniref:stromelysin-1-like isoform X2 n=1 Tax=Paroedura picta TaxID=143630 RepID=UPI0040570947